MAISGRFIDELVSRSDIVDVVGGFVQLTKRSGSNMFGLCPFHSEKTPSFSVSPEKQIYHCFGCGKGGGVINFIMEMENLSFRDAVHYLAHRAGLVVPDDSTDEETRGQRTRLLELNREAAKFFYETLATPQGRLAVEYINRRGISKEMVRRFGLGAAPDSWSALSDAMQGKGHSVSDLLAAGLVKKGKNGGVYDTFRNRLMFPVIDVRGSVIGFSGRILDDGEPKYLNSPETPVFNKSRNLFALNLAKKTKMGMIILAEGNIDVVALHQAGFDGAVASLGTSLTPEQARLMARYAESVVIAYDSDNAGVKAAQRAIGILEKTGVNVRVLRMEGAKDPDDFIKSKGPDAFDRLLQKSEGHVEYQLLVAKSKYDLEADDGRLGFMNEAADILSGLSSPVEREIYSVRVAEMIGVSADAVKAEVNRAFKRRAAARQKKLDQANLRPVTAAQPVDRSIRYDNPVSAVAEEGIIRLALIDPSLMAAAEGLTGADFTSPFLGRTFELIKKSIAEGRTPAVSSIAAELSPGEASHLTEIMEKPEASSERERAMGDYIDKIQTERLKKTAGADIMAVREKYKEKKAYGG